MNSKKRIKNLESSLYQKYPDQSSLFDREENENDT